MKSQSLRSIHDGRADAELEAIVAELADAGLLTIDHDADGRETWTLTEEGARVARMLAMKGDEAGDVLAALLGDEGR